MNDDGSVPNDNPFVGRKGYRPEIWTTGHRNAQGLAWQPGSGLMFQTEHGPSGFEDRGGGADEVNIVERGKNYGWPTIYGKMTAPGLVTPLLEYTPSCAPASAMFYTGAAFPDLKAISFRMPARCPDRSRRTEWKNGHFAGQPSGRSRRPRSRDGTRAGRIYLFFNLKPRRPRHSARQRRPDNANGADGLAANRRTRSFLAFQHLLASCNSARCSLVTFG